MKKNPDVLRTIVFVRHGQYKRDPEALTALGKKQARLTAKALKSLKPSQVYSSTMPRALETARIIANTLKTRVIKKDFFCEGILPGPKSFMKDKLNMLSDLRRNKKRADQAFHFLFQKPFSGHDLDIVVAHGNVIRHWVCKALKIDPKKWLKMDVIQGSLTTIEIDGKGNMLVLGLSDCGHLPLKFRTYI